MNKTIASIFELSPSEKLQLVEDLLDDLAASPDAVPVHHWQKEELARRKANLEKNPGSALTWDEVQRRVRIHHGSHVQSTGPRPSLRDVRATLPGVGFA